MKTPERRFRPGVHLLVCTNQRPPDAPLPCCALAGGQEVASVLRTVVNRAGLQGRVWVTQTGCLTFCNRMGATVVAYPSGRWFTEVRPEDAHELLSTVLHGGTGAGSDGGAGT